MTDSDTSGLLSPKLGSGHLIFFVSEEICPQKLRRVLPPKFFHLFLVTNGVTTKKATTKDFTHLFLPVQEERDFLLSLSLTEVSILSTLLKRSQNQLTNRLKKRAQAMARRVYIRHSELISESQENNYLQKSNTLSSRKNQKLY